MEFYSYLWLREDGTPYYAGKGCGRRAYRRVGHKVSPPIDKSRILVFPQENEADAFESEKLLIDLYGRKDKDANGLLRNLTDGGDGMSGYKFQGYHGHPQSADAKRKIGLAHRGKKVSVETRQKQSLARKGKPSSRKGYVASAETRKKQSVAAIRREKKSVYGGWNKGQSASDKTKRRVSEGLKNFWATHERAPISEKTREKMRQAKLGKKFHLGFKNSEETKHKMRVSALARRVREREKP